MSISLPYLPFRFLFYDKSVFPLSLSLLSLSHSLLYYLLLLLSFHFCDTLSLLLHSLPLSPLYSGLLSLLSASPLSFLLTLFPLSLSLSPCLLTSFPILRFVPVCPFLPQNLSFLYNTALYSCFHSPLSPLLFPIPSLFCFLPLQNLLSLFLLHSPFPSILFPNLY